MKRKIWVVGVLTLLLTLVLSGCFVKTVDELYTLPKHSDEYNDLQNAIDGLMAQGAAYSAPVSGANQQSVQLADLDGDGQDEAIVFLKTGGDKPLGPKQTRRGIFWKRMAARCSLTKWAT